VKVAVLDTGLDLGHPDFAGRQITAQSFVQGEQVQDGHGHGTHCIGTACGPRTPGRLPRYGIAYQAQIFAGKVLSNAGSGGDGGILAGIDWAIRNGCAVVSMSLGSPVEPLELVTPVLRTRQITRRRSPFPPHRRCGPQTRTGDEISADRPHATRLRSDRRTRIAGRRPTP
jgi:subtilisin family serine protease